MYNPSAGNTDFSQTHHVLYLYIKTINDEDTKENNHATNPVGPGDLIFKYNIREECSKERVGYFN